MCKTKPINCQYLHGLLRHSIPVTVIHLAFFRQVSVYSVFGRPVRTHSDIHTEDMNMCITDPKPLIVEKTTELLSPPLSPRVESPI